MPELTLNQRWIQFAFINSRGKLNKTALKLPSTRKLEINKEYEWIIADQKYAFSCEAIEQVNNNDSTYDEVYVVASPNS